MVRGDEVLSPPAKLRPEHDLSKFDSGEPALDDWLRRRALQNDESGARGRMSFVPETRWSGITH